MKANAISKGERDKAKRNHRLNARTMETYSELASKAYGRKYITPEQRKRVQEQRKEAIERKEVTSREDGRTNERQAEAHRRVRKEIPTGNTSEPGPTSEPCDRTRI